MHLPNPLSPTLMTPMERRQALCAILGSGLVRLRMRNGGVIAKSTELSPPPGESWLDCAPGQSGHATASERRDT